MVAPTARRAAALALTTLLGMGVVAPGAVAATGSFTITGGPTSPRALAADAGRRVYWGMDPTGTTAYAISTSGQVTGRVPLAFTPTDVEALAVHDSMLYVGDIGDAAANRSNITVYRLPNPTYGQGGSYRAWDLTYPDGQHDAAAMMVSPRGTVYVITRGTSAGIYSAPAQLSSTRTNQLTRVASAPDGVTDATFLPDGRVALRTTAAVMVLQTSDWSTVAQATLGVQGSGDALTTALGDQSTLMAGNSTQVDPVALPTTMGTLPSATPSASASATAHDADDHSTAKSRTGTFLALGGALLVALAAAAVVFLKR